MLSGAIAPPKEAQRRCPRQAARRAARTLGPNCHSSKTRNASCHEVFSKALAVSIDQPKQYCGPACESSRTSPSASKAPFTPPWRWANWRLASVETWATRRLAQAR
eukprot:8054760-Alexandrium_andersonii.AAC.1